MCLDHTDTSEVFKEDILRNFSVDLPKVSASPCLLQIRKAPRDFLADYFVSLFIFQVNIDDKTLSGPAIWVKRT